jgi:hypothetical protein
VASHVHARLALEDFEDHMAQKKQTQKTRDVVTLADLAPRHDVTGGSQRRVFGSDPITPSVDKESRDMKATKPTAKKAKDLPAKSGVKGGGQNLNDNVTLVRAAKPAPKKRDLPSRKDVKGGKKVA